MHHSVLALTVIAATSLASAVGAQSAADPLAFHAKVAGLYSFEPHKLTSQEIEAKSKVLDDFWAEVKAELKEERQRVMYRLSDEALHEFDT